MIGQAMREHARHWSCCYAGPMTRLEELKGKLAARERYPEYASNCEAIRKEIERLEKGS
jgi:hypothetical protein